MTKVDSTSQNGFMTGFVTGTVLSGIGLYLLGTKQGRQILTELIKLAEELEKNQQPSNHKNKEAKTTLIAEQTKTIKTVLDKLQTIIPDKEKIEKYFARDGKILK